MEKRIKTAIEDNKKTFIYAVAEAILLDVEGVDQIVYFPQLSEVASKFKVIMLNGTKYIISVHETE